MTCDEKRVSRRDPEKVMRLSRLGSFHQCRLSFMRTLTRRMAKDNWQFTRGVFELDSNGVGRAVYTATGPDCQYSLVAFAHELPDDKRSDRVIADAWDATFALFDRVPTQDDVDRLSKNIPFQEAGRVSESELTISRANRSVRLWKIYSIIQWDVRAYGNLSAWGFGDFQRTWSIEVGEQADQASSALNHLYAFTKKAVQEQGQKIENTALRQLAITEDDDVITIESKAGLVMESHGFLIMAAVAFAGGGALAALTGGLPGIMFGSVAVLVGLALFGVFIHAVGSAVETKIDTQNHLISSTKSFYGYMHRTHEQALLSADQITVEVTGGYTSGTEKVEYCSLVFTDTAYKKIKLAKEIKDKQKAEELRELVISRCFPEKELAAAA